MALTIKTTVAFCLVALALTGCATAPQRSVAWVSDPVGTEGKVGVVMTALPEVGTTLPGASCLLCLAAASVANSKLSQHSKGLPVEDLPQLKDKVAEGLRKKGTDVVVIDENLDVAKLPKAKKKGADLASKDFTSLRGKYGVDQLVVISINQLGFERAYAAYIPAGEPKAAVTGAGYKVNLTTNTYEWYQPVNVRISAEGNWDEPPNYPGLDNAYFQALEAAKDALLQPFNADGSGAAVPETAAEYR